MITVGLPDGQIDFRALAGAFWDNCPVWLLSLPGASSPIYIANLQPSSAPGSYAQIRVCVVHPVTLSSSGGRSLSQRGSAGASVDQRAAPACGASELERV